MNNPVSQRWPRLISHLFSPAYLALLLLLIIGLTYPKVSFGPSGKTAFLTCLCFLTVLPAGMAQESVLLRRLSLKTRRTISFVTSFFSYSACFVLCLIRNAPPLFIMVSASYLGTVILLLLVNLFFRASGHGSAVSGPVVAVNLLFPGWGLLSLPLLAVVTWARLAAKEHTMMQILSGMAIGAFSTVMSFLLIRPVL